MIYFFPGKTSKIHFCSICLKTFSRKDHLTRHIKEQHLNASNRIWNHACGKCGRKFKRNGHLKKHAEVCDSSYNKYKCSVCFIGYRRKDTYLDHLRKKHMMQFECFLCSARYSCRKELIFHIRKIHKTLGVETPEIVEQMGYEEGENLLL